MRTPLLVALMIVCAAPAWAAEEPSGCDKFKWGIDRERTALTAPDRIALSSGAELAALPPGDGPAGLYLFALDGGRAVDRSDRLGAALARLEGLRWRGTSRTPVDWSQFASASAP